MVFVRQNGHAVEVGGREGGKEGRREGGREEGRREGGREGWKREGGKKGRKREGGREHSALADSQLVSVTKQSLAMSTST